MRHVKLDVGGRPYETVLDDAVSLSIPLDFDGEQARAFGLPPAAAEPIEFGDAVCDTTRGGAFNADTLSLIPHANGTHTETVGHVVDQNVPVGDRLTEALIPCTLLTATPRPLDDTEESYPSEVGPTDQVVTRRQIGERASDLDLPRGFLDAVVLRSDRTGSEDRFRDYSGTNPPYLTREAVEWLLEQDVEHLLVDLPSIDREQEGGTLANHRHFWGLELEAHRQHPPSPKTVTELVYVPTSVPDGIYFLDVDLPDFTLDAAPSRPLLYEATPTEESGSTNHS